MGKRSTSPLVLPVVMCLGVILVYWPIPERPTHNTQEAGDYHIVHARRMAFARESIAESGSIPGWYPRESMGTPFWANIQNFPFIPTRLLILPLPPRYTFTAGVILAGVLAAVFTFLFARSIGLSPLAAAAAGWTFACSGYQCSHVITGQLPMVEVYPALPLLMWLVELNLRRHDDGDRTTPIAPRPLALGGLVLAAACVALAGHPQLGVYAFVTAGLYVLWRGWGAWRAMFRTGFAIFLGVACAAFSLWPTLLLIGRSTRTLPLARNASDIPFPYERLAAWVMPWKDGSPAVIGLPGKTLTGFDGYPKFLETVNYIGLLPLACAALLVVAVVVMRTRPNRVAVFLAIAGVLALATALPPFHRGDGSISLTLLRNPCRQTYVTTFALAIALAAGFDLIRRLRIPRPAALGHAIVAVLLTLHIVDLASHDRPFIRTTYIPDAPDPAAVSALTALVGSDGRVAMDFDLRDPINRRFDDVGFFDSIILARPYAKLLDLAGIAPRFNTQHVSGSDLPPDRLAELGVRAIVTIKEMADRGLVPHAGAAGVYAVPDSRPRATFVPGSDALQLDSATPATQSSAPRPAPVAYGRPSSDEILVRTRGTPAGFVRVIESFDPGWGATVNGRPSEVLPADDTFLAVSVPAGDSEVRFTYHTPGARAGLLISGIGIVLAACLVLRTSTTRAGRGVATPPSAPQNEGLGGNAP